MPRHARPVSATAEKIDRDRDQLLLLSDLTLAESIRHFSRHGGTILEDEGLLLFRGPHLHPNPFRNGALRLSGDMPGPEIIRRARKFFSPRRAFALWSREHADADLAPEIDRAGFQELERIPSMVMEGRPAADKHPLPDGVEIRHTTDDATRKDLLRVVAAAWGLGGTPLEMAADLLFHPDAAAGPQVSACVAYENGEPVSGAMEIDACGVLVGVQGVTVPSAQGRGLSQATSHVVFEDAHARCGANTSIIQSSSAGLPAWLAFGFVPFTAYRRYLVPPVKPGV